MANQRRPAYVVFWCWSTLVFPAGKQKKWVTFYDLLRFLCKSNVLSMILITLNSFCLSVSEPVDSFLPGCDPETPPWPCDLCGRSLCVEVFPPSAPVQLLQLCKWAQRSENLCVLWDSSPAMNLAAEGKKEKALEKRGLMGDWIVSSFEVRLLPRGWEESAPVRVQPRTSSIYRRCWRRTERDLARQRLEIQVQVWQSPIAATGWLDWFVWSSLALMMHFYHFFTQPRRLCDCVVCVWDRT